MNLIYPYVASENFLGASDWVASKGLRPAKHPDDLASQMQFVVDRDGERALNEIKSIHPDKELFADYSGGKHNYSNSCGCSGADGYSNANGQSIKAEVEKMLQGKDRDSKVELMILAGTILVALALIVKK